MRINFVEELNLEREIGCTIAIARRYGPKEHLLSGCSSYVGIDPTADFTSCIGHYLLRMHTN